MPERIWLTMRFASHSAGNKDENIMIKTIVLHVSSNIVFALPKDMNDKQISYYSLVIQ